MALAQELGTQKNTRIHFPPHMHRIQLHVRMLNGAHVSMQLNSHQSPTLSEVGLVETQAGRTEEVTALL